MAYGKGGVTSNAINQHREMAGAGMKNSNFGVKGFESAAVRKGRAITGASEGRGDGYRRDPKA